MPTSFYVRTHTECLLYNNNQYLICNTVGSRFNNSRFNNNLDLTIISLPPKHIVKSRSDCTCTNSALRFPSEQIIHEDWNEARFRDGSDIALIRMDRPVKLALVCKQ